MSRISARYGSGTLRAFTVVIAGALAVGCGGASRQYPASAPASAPSPPAASSDAEASKAGATYSQPSQQMPAPASAPMAPPAPAPVSPAAPRDVAEAPSRSRAQQGESDLQAAERGVASSDCPTACRALGSMERAVVFLCASSAEDGGARHCGDAKGRLVSARRRVRTTCGECPSGPSVDPDAPVPSRR